MTRTPSNPQSSPDGKSGKKFQHGNCSISVSTSSERQLRLSFRLAARTRRAPGGAGLSPCLCVSVVIFTTEAQRILWLSCGGAQTSFRVFREVRGYMHSFVIDERTKRAPTAMLMRIRGNSVAPFTPRFGRNSVAPAGLLARANFSRGSRRGLPSSATPWLSLAQMHRRQPV